MPALIECKGLCHSYGEKVILRDLSFSVDSGGIFGLLGKNGVGKSTTINILMGFLRPTSGECRILGDPSHNLSTGVRSRIGLLHEGFIQYDYMSIAELEHFHAPFYPRWDRDVFFDLVKRLHVPHSRKLSQLSCGQRSQVVLGLIMAQQPELMILDDYSMGLDVGYRRLFLDFLKEYVTHRGTTVMLTSHVVQELDRVVQSMVVLKDGRTCVSSTKEAFMDSFSCFRFNRTQAADALDIGDDFFTSVEHLGNTIIVYGFFHEEELRQRLTSQGIPADGLTRQVLDFEDAFIGLTGKY